ncbi:MAG: bifunctional 4-hydroxy-2-oxoglutarate aldolase/2-dehydro-3-deoxy-phosphogluconate aldolase [Christensenellales bacterium]|jgi:2-dehydro-3-deoxyphosphogluconate aldolase/(4S)-4-hydroxy-2-oxoglutarate aldolase
MDIYKQIELAGIIPLIKLERLEKALPLMGALTAGSINLCEIAFRTQIAKEAIALIAQKSANMVVGASTVLSTMQVDDAIEAGARFIVTAGFNEKVVDYCLKRKVPVIPGVSSPSDIEKAYEREIYVVKFFPAVPLGGVEMLKALAQPYPFMRFLPTGGINQDNLNEFLAFNRVIACGGSYMVNEELIKEDRYEEITKNARNAVNSMLNLRLDHIVLSAKSQERQDLATEIATLLGAPFVYEEGEKIGDMIAVSSRIAYGKHGAIFFSTPHLERAIFYLEKRGFEFCRATTIKDNGKLNALYLKANFAGFAIGLVKAP